MALTFESGWILKSDHSNEIFDWFRVVLSFSDVYHAVQGLQGDSKFWLGLWVKS